MSVDYRAAIARIDQRLQDLEKLYTEELAKELATGKHNLLISRVYKNRIEKLERERTALVKKVSDAPTKWESWRTEKAQREALLNNDYEYKAKLYKELTALATQMFLAPAQDSIFADIKLKQRAVKEVELCIRNRERGLFSFLAKEPAKPDELRTGRRRSLKSAETDAEIEQAIRAEINKKTFVGPTVKHRDKWADNPSPTWDGAVAVSVASTKEPVLAGPVLAGSLSVGDVSNKPTQPVTKAMTDVSALLAAPVRSR